MRELWNDIVGVLRASAHLFGTEDAEQVRRGRFGEQALRAPFVLVYLLPGRSAESAEQGMTAGHLAFTLDVFVGVEPAADVSDAVCTATERAVCVMEALSQAEGFEVMFDDDPVTLDTSTSDFTAVRVGATVYPNP